MLIGANMNGMEILLDLRERSMNGHTMNGEDMAFLMFFSIFVFLFLFILGLGAYLEYQRMVRG